MGKAVIAGVVAGLVGAAVWAGVAYFLNMEIGWVAWGIGLLVGVAVGSAARDEAGATTGGIAVVIAVLSILGGKWAVIELLAQREIGAIDEEIAALVIMDEDCIVRIADETHDAWLDAGYTINFPVGYTIETAYLEEHYPSDLWRAAAQEWDALGLNGQDEMRDEMRGEVREEALAQLGKAKGSAFQASFSLFDIVFFGLAIITAFKVGAGVRNE